MPTLCSKCGAPLAGAFCMKCGQPAEAPSASAQPKSSTAQAQPAAPSAPAPKAVKKSHWGKVLAIVACILLLLFITAIAAALYGVHWIKNKVASYTGGGSSAQVKVESGNSCGLLSKDELQQVLGVAVEKNAEIMEQSEPGCAYYTNPEAFAQLQKMAMEQARRDAEQASKQPGPKTDNPLELLKNTNQMEGVVKGLGLTQPDKEGRVFSFTVQRDFGRSNWSTLRATMSVVPGFEEVPEVGDHAMVGSFGHTLCVLKGDSMVRLDLLHVPEAKTRGADIGRKIAAHL